MKSRILITGGLGYIGSHTALKFINESNHHIVLIDNLSNSNLSVLESLKALSKKNFLFYQADIGDSNLLSKILDNEKIDSIIHFAALKSVPDSISNPSKYFQNNILSLLKLINIIENYEIKSFILSSSATVYSYENLFPVSEDGLLNYENPYGQTKLISEDIIKRLYLRLKLNVGILRYFNPIGNISSGDLGDPIKKISTNIMPMIYRALRQNLAFNIYGNDYETQDGTPIRDFIHVEDLAEAHKKIFEYINNQSGLHTFNVGTGNGVSVKELIDTFCKVNDVRLKVNYQKRRQGDLPICYADTKKICSSLDWLPQYNIGNMCVDSYSFFKKNYLS